VSTEPSPRSSDAAPLVLASTSRYRRELLARLGMPFEVRSPHVDEVALPGERPRRLAERLALAKAEAVAALLPQAVVIGSDQTASIDGVEVIGKPGTHERAVAQLRAASGRTLSFHTGLAVVRPATGFRRVVVVDTRVRFRPLTDAMIEAYLAREPAYDCAGSAKSEGLGIALIAALEGNDPSALVGLPLIELTAALQAAGLPVL
jgi:septum formation protein